MQGDAKFWIVSAALALCGCAGGVVDEPQRKLSPQAPQSAEDPYNVIPSRAGNAGAGGQFGKGGATSSPAGGAGTAGAGTAGAGTAGAGTAGAGTAGAGTAGAGTAGAGTAAGSSG